MSCQARRPPLLDILFFGVVTAVCFAPPEPAGGAMTRTVIVGDSLTADADVGSPNRLWWEKLSRSRHLLPHVLARGCQTAGPATLPCFGVRTPGAAATYSTAIHDLQPDAIIIELGTNDHGLATPLYDFLVAYTQLLNAYPWNMTVCIIPPPTVGEEVPNAVNLALDDYRAEIRQMCASGIIVETQQPMSIAEHPGYYRDGLHLTPAGHAALWRTVERALP
jgi:lysophospholipase L1-like esterase